MKRRILIVFIFFSSFIYSQKDSDELFKVENTSVSVLEFKKVYEKNLSLLVDDKQKDVKNYLDLYIKFKLKFAEAKHLKLDSTRAYKREIETYKNQLIAPYLQDSTFIEELIKNAYYRTKHKVNASHILVKIPKGTLPKDTLPFYNRILKARGEILSGKSFSKVALKYSEDQSVKSNFGNLGYFTAFKMVYPFENAVYNTKVGEISKPFRTRFGYHFVKVNDLKLSEGEIEVAHILITDTSNFGKQKIDSIYKELLKGASFNSLVLKHSNDKSTVSNAGRLPKFGVGRMLKSFEDASFKLKEENELTTPFKTNFGWHIVKLIKKHPVKSFEDLRNELANRVSASGGARMSDLLVLNKLKRKYKISINTESKKVFKNKNIRAKKRDSLNKILITINNKKIKQYYFYDYIRNRRHKPVDILFNEFLDQEVLNYFKENLSKTEPKFARTLQEYKEGLIVFDLMQHKVWNKSTTDTVGLQSYFDAHKTKYTFKELSINKGLVMSDYQDYLEKALLKKLKDKYQVKVRNRTFKKLVRYYREND
jgi:peptidyl-prolyl cis-trans isomerase SurA